MGSACDPMCHGCGTNQRQKVILRGHMIKIWKACIVRHTWTIQWRLFINEVKHRVTNLGCTSTLWLKGTKSSDNRRIVFHRQTAAQTSRASALSIPAHQHTHIRATTMATTNGVALAMHHTLQWFIHLWAHSLDSFLHVLCVLLYTVCMCRFVSW